MVAKPRNWGNEIIKMILIVSNHDKKKILNFLLVFAKHCLKHYISQKSIAIQSKNGRTPTQIKYTQRQSKNVRPGRDCTRKHCQEIKRNVYLIDNIFLVSV